jgi:hypothetical protein
METDSLVGRLQRLAADIGAAQEDLCYNEGIILDVPYKHIFDIISSWQKEILDCVNAMYQSRFDKNEIQVIFNPIDPK